MKNSIGRENKGDRPLLFCSSIEKGSVPLLVGETPRAGLDADGYFPKMFANLSIFFAVFASIACNIDRRVFSSASAEGHPSADGKVNGTRPLFNRRTIKRGSVRLFICVVWFAICGFCSTPARAAASLEDVSKSIQNSDHDSIDGRKLLAVLLAGTGVVILVVVINNRQERRELPRTLNHSGKLLRELMKSAGLKSSQIRQLKLLSDELADKEQPVENLVTLLLCPSLIKKARDRTERRA